MSQAGDQRVVLLAGGVGGARLARPLAAALPDGARLTVVVNVGDDFEHCGLAVSPDLDTVVYHLAGLADAERGWGMADESFRAMAELARLGGPTWFALGDRDLATHLYRTHRRAQGAPLSQITAEICRRRGLPAAVEVLPASDDPVRTWVDTAVGWLPFQTYLVERGARDPVRGFAYQGAEQARPAPGVVEALAAADRIIVAPSNPFVSLAPILAVTGIRQALEAAAAPILGVSPLIGGRAVKGPLADMLRALGRPVTATAALTACAIRWRAVWLDPADAALAPELEHVGIATVLTPLALTRHGAAVARSLLKWPESEREAVKRKEAHGHADVGIAAPDRR